MRSFVNKLLLIASSTLLSAAAFAEPWYTGPLLAPSGHTIPAGHSNLETYIFYTRNNGTFDRHWRLIHTPANESTILNPLFSHGLTDKIDIQYSVPYSYNINNGASRNSISDTSVALGYQLLEQKDSKWRPDLRIVVQETVPTGQYELLSPLNNGTDAMGLGSYQTGVALNFQHLMQLTEINYLRTRLSLAYIYANDVRLHGLNTYGGSIDTDGILDPGNLTSADLAAELNVTQHWVAVMEGYVAHRQATHFAGYTGRTASGLPAPIGHDVVNQVTIAPAIEYNFNANVGIIGGVWLSATGQDTSDFASYIIALNAYW